MGLAMLAPLILLQITPLGSRVRRTKVLRFGFAGPPRYVELMQVDARPSEWMLPRDVGRVVTHPGPKGDPGKPTKPVPRAAGARNHPTPGQFGESGGDLVARAIASQGKVPVMMSSELVIEELVRPEYPEEARRREIEGHVSVIARVDTLGNIAEAQVMNPSGERTLDEAARLAVLRCRFRPYREAGKVTEVYAVFRFAFRIY